MSEAGYWDRQYNPRLSVPEAADYFASWSRRATEARAARPPVELSYGEHEREKLDLFRVSGAHGTLVFIHGGYWRAFGKQDLSWIAPPFVDAGITVAVLGYPLRPEVSLARIGQSIFRAMDYLASSVLTREEQQRVVLAGHSAGGHLSACYQSNPKARRADAIVCISGLFDLMPLKQTEMLASLSFEVPELHAASPLFAPAPESGQVMLAVGEGEPVEFHWQSARLASAWSSCQPEVLAVPERNHFSVVEAFAEPAQPLFQRTLGYLR